MFVDRIDMGTATQTCRSVCISLLERFLLGVVSCEEWTINCSLVVFMQNGYPLVLTYLSLAGIFVVTKFFLLCHLHLMCAQLIFCQRNLLSNPGQSFWSPIIFPWALGPTYVLFSQTKAGAECIAEGSLLLLPEVWGASQRIQKKKKTWRVINPARGHHLWMHWLYLIVTEDVCC